ncbi:MAG: acetoin utilization protein AcuC [SAR202 cluster bacterium]|nr:acetoin utilization protein AcuC [SAR202 cluster bacterium]
MARRTAFIYDDSMADHVLSEDHPMKPVRLRYTFDLAGQYGLLETPRSTLVASRMATVDEITRFHTPDYVAAVRAISNGDSSVNQRRYNFAPGDNPPFRGMYEASLLSTGGSVRGVDLLLDEGHDAVLNISGGLHHAMPSYVYGFCVFNDPVIAIKELVRRGLKVAYVDIDCHHGDGVQHAFYDTDRVLTISLHESGQYIFPGTGYPQELGAGKGRGYSVNLPLYPYTSDEVYYWAFMETVPPLLQAFRPDVLVSQLGIDSHYNDPITHLSLTVQGFGRVVSEMGSFAPKWLALGGGGYDLQAVARAWTLAYAIMAEEEVSDELPMPYRHAHGVQTLTDHEDISHLEKVQPDARTFAQSSVQAVQRLIFPLHGIRS